MSNRPEWFGASSNDHVESETRQRIQACGVPLAALSRHLAGQHGGDPVLSGLIGAIFEIAWAYKADPGELANHLRMLAEDVPKVFALYDRDRNQIKPN